MTDTEIKKIYVADDGAVTLICPQCGSVRRETVENYKDLKGPLRVECSCSHSYEVRLEFRKSYRKGTNIEGLYIRSSRAGDWGKMIVKNLSMGGVVLKRGINPHWYGDKK